MRVIAKANIFRLGLACLIIFFIFAVLFWPAKSFFYDIKGEVAVPEYFDPGLTKHFESQGLKLTEYSEWSIDKFLRSGPEFVIANNTVALSAKNATGKGKITKLYPETVIVAAISDDVEKITDFGQLVERKSKVYLDQGMSRIEIMAALSQITRDGGQDFNADRGLKIVEDIQKQGRLEVGKTLLDLHKAVSRGSFCVTSDRRIMLASDIYSEVNMAVPKTLTFWRAFWDRNPDGQNRTRVNPKPPASLLTPENFPSIKKYSSNPDSASYRNAQEVTNLVGFQDLAWEITQENQTYDGSPRWKDTNESLKMVSFLSTLVLLSFWAGWRYWTVSSPYVRTAAIIQATVLITWVAARIIKHASLGVFERYTWYYYYVPICTSLAILFFVINHSASSKLPGYRWISKTIIVCGAALFVAAYTNDFHHLVIRFGKGSSNIDYYYGPIYYLFYLFDFVLSGLIVYSLMHFFRGRRVRVGGAFLGLFFLVIAYSIPYTLRWPWVRSTENVQVYTFFLILGWEVLFLVGVLKQNHGYLRLFRAATVPISLLDSSWKPKYYTSTAEKIDPVVLDSLRKGINPYSYHQKEEGDGSLRVRSLRFTERPIRGGHALWVTDVSVVRELEATLRSLRQREQRQTEVLSAEYAAMLQLDRSRKAPELYDRLDVLMRDALGSVLSNSAMLSRDLEDQERRRLLRDIKLDLGYAKRAGLLVLQSLEKDTVAVNVLTTFLSQSCTDFSAKDVHVGLNGPTKGEVGQNLALTILEGLHKTLSAISGLTNVVAFVRLKIVNEKEAELYWLWEVDSEAISLVARVLEWNGAQSALEKDADALHLTMAFSDDEDSCSGNDGGSDDYL